VHSVVLALLGAAILVPKPPQYGSGEVPVQSYAGNVAVSFALYFAAVNATERFRNPRLVAHSPYCSSSRRSRSPTAWA
jgi:hypothetical protein